MAERPVADVSHCGSGVQAGDEDGWDEALGYMEACGPGWHLQIARTTSDDGLANSSLISHASGLSNCFLGDSQRSVSTCPHMLARLQRILTLMSACR